MTALPLQDKHNSWEHYLAECGWDYIKGIQSTLQFWFYKTDFQAYILPIFFKHSTLSVVQGNKKSIPVQKTWNEMYLLKGSFK